MVRITKVHTGGGDGVKPLLSTVLVSERNIKRVAIYGTIDEANSALGMVRMEISRSSMPMEVCDYADKLLGIIQQELFDVGAECACPPGGIPEQMSIMEQSLEND